MEATIVVYHLPSGSSQAQHNRLRWLTHGRDTSSWQGRYKYHRPGILERTPHIDVHRGVVVLGREDAEAFVEEVARLGAVVWSRQIILDKRDMKTLKAGSPGGDRA